jgi:hypothetical protein
MKKLKEFERWVESLKVAAANTSARGGWDAETEWISVAVADLVTRYVQVKKCEHLRDQLLEEWRAAHPLEDTAHGISKSK